MRSHPRVLVVGSDHRLIRTTDWRTLVACFVAAITLACAGALAAAPLVQAATTTNSYGYLTSFGSPDPGVPLGQHNGVAVDGDGNIFVPQDTSGPAIGVYAPDASLGGTALTAVDLSTASGGGPVGAADVAVDTSNGTVYFRDGNGNLYRFVSDGQPTPTYTQDLGFAPPALGGSSEKGGLAVDPTTHDVLVADHEATTIQRVAPSGAVSGSIALAGIKPHPHALAVGQAGAVYVIDDNGVEHFAADGTELPSLSLPAGFAPQNIAANTLTGEVAVLGTSKGQYYLQGFSAGGAPTFSERLLTDTFTLPADAPPRGLAWDPITDRIYYTTDYGAVHTFAPGPAPGLDTPTATNVTPTTADLSAGLAPAGSTNARLEICPVSATLNPCTNYPVSAPADAPDPSNPWQRLSEQVGLSGSAVEDTATGLLPNTTYDVRAVALNTTAGTETTSDLGSFHTLVSAPLVTTGAATAITDASAELTGSIDNTFGDPTGFHFEYGLTTNYGSRVPAQSEAAGGASRDPRTFSRSITGLQPGTTYHYRIVATNSGGTSEGADRTFTTLGADEVAPQRAYEQVSPVDKGGAVILTLTQFSIAPDGNSMVIPVAAAPPDANGVMIFQHFVVHRGTDGWSSWKQTDPPQNLARGTFESSTLGISADYDHALVVSNRALAPGGIAGAANVYIFDVASGAYTLVATSSADGAFESFVGLQQNTSYFVNGAPDFSWVIFHSPVPLLNGVTTTGLYKWSRSEGLTLLSQMPGDTPTTENVPAHFPGVLSARQASADGNIAYFAINGDGIGGAGGIFRRAAGQTVAISVSHASGGPAGIQPGWLDGVSADGRYAVFRSQSKLTDDALDQTGQSTTNIYRYDAQDDSLQYLATGDDLLGRLYAVSDDTRTVLYQYEGLSVWRDGAVQHIDSQQVPVGRGLLSPNGRYVAYRTGSGGTGNEYAPVYLYDTETQQRTCVSCQLGTETGGDRAYTNFDARGLGNFAPQVVTDNGIIFFDTPDALIPADHNSARDVYAFQNGQLTLISPGDGDYQAHFMGASNEGRDVFFATSEGLVGQDTDRSIDVYDARVGGGFPEQNPSPPPAPCVRAECGELGARPIASPVAPSERTQPAPVVGSRISLGKVVVTSRAVKITFRAPHAGRLTASGPQVLKAHKRIPKAGTYRIKVPLGRKARSMIRAHERLKLTVRLTLAGAGNTTSATLKRTIGR